MARPLIISIFLFFIIGKASSQEKSITINGLISDEKALPIPGVNISVGNTGRGTSSNAFGAFQLLLNSNTLPVILHFSHVEYETTKIELNDSTDFESVLTIRMLESADFLDTLEIVGKVEASDDEVSVVELDPTYIKTLPSAFSEFSKILVTLPGVVSNNELSSQYSVRGGSFDENLVYVNDILIYRPFLVRAGQQEGLSFVNSDMVDNVEFSSGGWQPKYGDKLSSTLNITYKKPSKFGSSVTASILGGAAHIEGISKNKKITYITGARLKSSRYLLNTLETEGQYFPRFLDLQSYINFNLGKNKARNSSTDLGVLVSFAENQYFVQPESRETVFGNFSETFQLFVGFDGQESLEYNTWQGGVKLSHRFNSTFETSLITSYLITKEREYFDVESGYRICDVALDPTSGDFNKCVSTLGLGTSFRYGRNQLDADIYNAESRSVWHYSPHHQMEFGLRYSNETISDVLNEYSFSDSADFVFVEGVLEAPNSVSSQRMAAYVQNKSILTDIQNITYGVRFNYWNFNEQLLISPRVQYSILPRWEKDVTIKASLGMYQQPPFYREYRRFDGSINENIKAQSSVHMIVGSDYIFKMWGRDFKFSNELYYKHLYNVIPYDVDNVKLRYYAENNAKAYATGIDMRVNGEFIQGAESWFSLGILSTKENVEGDNLGYIRRPTDQRVNVGIFFQDHLANNPSMRMYLNLLFGSGLPFGPPGNVEFRNALNGSTYRRVDLGLSKIIELEEEGVDRVISSIWIGLEILNLLATSNPISYIWVEDFQQRQFAVPNALSARFVNLKVIVKI